MANKDEHLRKWLVNTAERYGAAVMHVAADDRGPGFAFSVGTWRRFGRPEVVVIGLPRDVGHAVVNTYVGRARAGERFEPGRLYEGFLQGCPITLEKVAKPYYPEFFGSAFLVYGGDDFSALQIIASAPGGVFPWQDNAPEGFAEYQPVLTASGRPESWIPGHDGP